MLLLSKIIETIFDEHVTAQDLLRVVAFLACFWAVFFTLLSALLRPLVCGKPWLVAAGERDYEHGGKEEFQKLGMDLSSKQFVEQFMNMWPWTVGVILQHLLGGMLCLPSIFNVGDPQVAASLACLGILSEMGWEIQDIITWIYKRFGLPQGKAMVPTALIAILAVHHSLTTCLGIPIILHYRSLKTLHLICFDLQAAAASALFVKEYSKMLDVSIPNQLRQFQILSYVALAIMVWTRGIHWILLSAKFMTLWYQQGAWGFLTVGTLMIFIFSGFNWLFCIAPCYKRVVKFMQVSAQHSALPKDAPIAKRRSSVDALEMAAADVFGHHDLDEKLAALFVHNRRVSRRSTMPASLNRRRVSWALLRSSAGDVSRVISQMGVVDDAIVKQD